VPKQHYRWIYEYPEMGSLFSTAGLLIRAIIPVLGADHATLATYGHEIKHAHIWIVPQYAKTVTGERNKAYKSEENQVELAEKLRLTLKREVSV
jgi:hypothetical protein